MTRYWFKNVGDDRIGWPERPLWEEFDARTHMATIWFPEAHHAQIHAGDWLVIYAAHGPGRVIGFGQILTPLVPRTPREGWDARYPWQTRVQLEAFIPDNPFHGWDPVGHGGRLPIRQGSHHAISEALYAQLLDGFRRHSPSGPRSERPRIPRGP